MFVPTIIEKPAPKGKFRTLPARLAALSALLAVAGCAGGLAPFGGAPAPSLAAPSPGSVSQSPLPPLNEAPVASAPLRVGGGNDAVLGGRSSSPPVAATGGPADGATTVALSTSDVLGGWTVNVPGASCQLFTSLTSWSGGYRAVTTGCEATDLAGVQSWTLDGRQMVLRGDSGRPIARLRATAGSRFDGLTAAGLPVTVYR